MINMSWFVVHRIEFKSVGCSGYVNNVIRRKRIRAENQIWATFRRGVNEVVHQRENGRIALFFPVRHSFLLWARRVGGLGAHPRSCESGDRECEFIIEFAVNINKCSEIYGQLLSCLPL